MKSKIFTPAEEEELNRRLKGEKKNYKIWYRVKPKIIEMLSIWFPMRETVKKLLISPSERKKKKQKK